MWILVENLCSSVLSFHNDMGGDQMWVVIVVGDKCLLHAEPSQA